MKRITTILVILLAATFIAGAQECPDKDRLMSEKIAFFTSELQLTPEEAQQFWPVYNQMWEKRKECHKASREKMRKMKDAINKKASDKEIEILLNDYLISAEKCDNMRMETKEQFEKILSPTKTAKLFIAEEEFMMKQMRELKDRRKSSAR